MAKEKQQKANKEPGRIKQMVQVYRTTKEHDKQLPWIMLLVFLAPIAAATLVALLLPGGWISIVLWVLVGVLTGLLLAMIVLGRRAEAMAYKQIAGRPGAVGAVVQGALRRSWRGSETPVAINRSQDAVYQVVGRGGVVLIGEGPQRRTRQMVEKQTREVKRALPNVKVTALYVGPDEEGTVELHRLSRTLYKLKPTLRRPEVLAVYNRLSSLQSAPIGIPKGVDPNRVRRQRPR